METINCEVTLPIPADKEKAEMVKKHLEEFALNSGAVGVTITVEDGRWSYRSQFVDSDKADIFTKAVKLERTYRDSKS